MCVCTAVHLCVGPAKDWQPVQGIPCIFAQSQQGLALASPDPYWMNGIDNGWIDGWTFSLQALQQYIVQLRNHALD